MKKCTYCGLQYADNVDACAVDGEQLGVDSPPPAPIAKTPDLIFPAYQWRAPDGWKFIGILLVLECLVGETAHLIHLSHPVFYRSGMGSFLISALMHAIEILTAAYFARTETLATFWQGFGLDHKPTRLVWLGILAALLIRLSGHFMITQKWGPGVTVENIHMFNTTTGWARCFFLLSPVLLAPLCEETAYRGFLFKAFRRSHPMVISTVLLVLWAMLSHWLYYSQSWIAALDLSALTVIQCYLREKSGSLWDTIICHFTYNVSLLLFVFKHS